MKIWQHASGILGLLLLIVGSSIGLLAAPPEKHMGDVSRILFAHVPVAWNMLLVSTFVLVFAVCSLWSSKPKWDTRLVGALETTVVLTVAMLATGMIFARPTWGVWWDWDVRLTTSLIGLLLFGGVMALRAFVDEPKRRATWTAVATIIAWVDIPIIYFCVRWWRSLHQIQSTPDTVSSGMILPLRINAFAILFLAIWFISMRSQIERVRMEQEDTPPPARLEPATA